MILPPRDFAAGPATTTTSSPASPGYGYRPGNWSSLIGIVTAIVGNVLISFALNLQRYAHIRLEREWQEKERLRKSKRGVSVGHAVDGGSKGSRHHDPPRRTGYIGEDQTEEIDEGVVIPSETDPLLHTLSHAGPRSRSRPTLKSSNSSSTNRETSQHSYKQQSYLKSPWWWSGIILMSTGEAGNFLAYGFAPASIVSPLGVVALISNCIIAPIMLKESFRKRDALGVFVAVSGAVTVVLSANDNNPKLGPEEIWGLITRWEFETYLAVTVVVIAALMVASNRVGERSTFVDLGLVGLFGGYTALSTKGVASLLSYTLWRAITFPITYLLVAILVFTAIMQIKYINRALQRFDATQVIPVQFVLFTLSVILGSAILYRDFERTSASDAGKFVGGCALTFTGVWLITSGRHREVEDVDEEDGEQEGEYGIHLANGERYHDIDESIVGEEDGFSDSRGESTRAVDRKKRKSSIQDAERPSTPRRAHTQQTPPPSTTNPILAFSPASPTPDTRTQNPPSATNRPPPAPIIRHSSPVGPSSSAPLPDTSTTLSTSTPASLPLTPQTPTRSGDLTTPNMLPPRLRRLETAASNNTTPDRVNLTPTSSIRNSIPGPLLASPLSTSLSAMVADLKRGGSLRSTPSSSLWNLYNPARDTESGARGERERRRESVLGIGAGESAGFDGEDEGEVLARRSTHTEGYVDGGRARGRSLSATLGDLWRGVRGQADAGVEEREGG